MATFATNSGTIGFTVIENAAPQDTVFLNGNLATSRWWLPTLEYLKPLLGASQSQRGRMILVELPGCGEGSKVDHAISIPQLVDEYLKLLAHLEVKSAYLVGHSTGGLLASWLMALKPAVFTKAVLLDPVGAQGIQFDDLVLDKYEEMKSSKDLTAAIIGFTILNNDPNSAFFKQIIVEDTFDSVKSTGSRMIQALRGFNSEEIVKKISGQVTILFGEKDVLLPKADAVKLSELIPNSRFIEIPDAGHCLNIEDPQRMAEVLNEYLYS